MAAVLKKRVVAELSQGSQSPPSKKFKTSDPTVQRPNIPLDLNKCKTDIDVYQALTSLSENFPIAMECVGPLIDHLLEYYQLESEFSVKVKILEILQQLLQYPSCDSKSLYHIIKEYLKNEKSNIVINEMLSIMLTVALLNYGDHKLTTDIVHLLLELLRIKNHVVRSKCLEMLGRIASPDFPYPSSHHYMPGRHTILDDVIIVSTMDSDWRVRLSALEALLTWHHRKLPLGSSLYGHLTTLLEDDEEKVRSTTLKLLWVVAQRNPDMMIETKEGNEIVADNCFVKLCEATTDISISVRTHASRLLGNIQEVSVPILFQTLEKKLMSNYRKKVSAHERQREMFMSGEWSAGKVADDAPREKLNPNCVTIVSKGACGAFVNGLEDEFSCVRNASLDSLCGFSCRHPSFLQYSQDFVVDMLTDEIDSVRLNGVNSLHKMSQLLSIRDDQLELILGVLKDFYSYMREATHRLLSSCNLSTTTGIKMTVSCLLQNLSQYPGDRPSIWRTMKALGERNSTLVFAVLPSLLGLHQFYDTKESALDDPAYVALVILASNASLNCSTMTCILPPNIFAHFTHLNTLYPHLIPETKIPHSGITNMCKAPTASLSTQKKFMNTVLSQLDKINFMRNISSAYKLLKIACRDLNKVNELAQDMSATAMFVTLHLRCQVKINEILTENKFTLGWDVLASVGQQIQKLMRTLTYMKTAFIGITSSQLVAIQQLSLVASAFQIIYEYQSSSPACRKSACFVFSDQVAKLNNLLSQTNLPSTRMLSYLNTEFNLPHNREVRNYHMVLLSALEVHASTVPQLPQVDNQLLIMRATIIEPTSDSDFVHTVVPNYILPLKMIVELENVEHIDRIRIYVQYTNQRQYLTKPKSLDFQTINRMNHKLDTMVMISGAMWSEPCQVRISIVYIPPDSLGDLPACVTSKLLEESKFATSEEYIQLSKVVTATIQPSLQRDSLCF